MKGTQESFSQSLIYVVHLNSWHEHFHKNTTGWLRAENQTSWINSLPSLTHLGKNSDTDIYVDELFVILHFSVLCAGGLAE